MIACSFKGWYDNRACQSATGAPLSYSRMNTKRSNIYRRRNNEQQIS